MSRGPAEEKAWTELREAADAGPRSLGAPVYLSVREQLEFAHGELLRAHNEIQRVLRLAEEASRRADEARTDSVSSGEPPGVKLVGRPERLASARSRHRQGILSTWSYIRTVAWIVFKSKPEIVPDRRQPMDRDRPAPGPDRQVSSDFRGDRVIRSLMESQDYDRAALWASALVPKHGRNQRFLDLVSQVHVKRGNVSGVLAVAHRKAMLSGATPGLAERKIEGRLREVSGWIPSIPGPRTVIVPASDRIILHLVKESRPLLSNGFTSRSHHNFLAEAGVGLEPVVVTELGYPRRLGQQDFDLEEYVDGIRHLRLDSGGSAIADLPLDQWLEQFAVLAYHQLLRIRPSVIHVSSGRRGYDTALVGLALKEKTGLPLVYEVRSFFEGTWTADTRWEDRGETFLRRRATEIMCMERADAVITLGSAMKADLLRAGIPESKIFIVPNGVDLGDFEVRPRDVTLAAATGVGEHLTFGYVSNMDHPREGHEVLIDACALLRARGSGLHCVLVGDGSRRAALERRAQQKGVGDRVHFLGSVDHTAIGDYYALIDLFVVPRVDERAARFVTPLKPFEAMAMGRPVITSSLPALTEITDPPLRGLSFDAGRAEALAGLLWECEQQPDSLREMAANARAWIEAERQWAANGERYRAIYDWVRAEGS